MAVKTAESEDTGTDSYFGGIGSVEAGRRGGAARSAKAKARREAAEAGAIDGARTFRQRLGVALSKLAQDELDAVVSRMAKAGNANALARLADQAFGRPNEQDEAPSQSGLGELSREELAGALAELDALPSTPPVDAREGQDAQHTTPPTPALAEPQAGDFHREPLTEREDPEIDP